MAQTVKDLPPKQKTWAQSLGQEDPLEKEKVTHFSTLAWKIPWIEDRDAWWATVHRVTKLDTPGHSHAKK